jgi:hypothetical protein
MSGTHATAAFKAGNQPTGSRETPMSGTTTPAGGNEPTTEGTEGGESSGTTTFSQEDVDRVVSERLARERAKFADYNDLKSKAKRLAEIEDANRSETEKAVEKARAEARAEAMTAGNSRAPCCRRRSSNPSS